MTDVDDRTIEREIVVQAPIEVVWRTITERDQIEQWFADRVELDLRPGGSGVLVFEHGGTSSAVTVPIVVEAVEPPHRLAFRWSQPEGQAPVEGNSMLVELVLTVEGDELTRLRVVETGIDLVQWSEQEKARYVEDHRHGWSTHLARLGERLGLATG